jgi:hypothetical protein
VEIAGIQETATASIIMNIPKIQSATPQDGHFIVVLFSNGQKKRYDISHLVKHEIFLPLQNPAFLKTYPLNRVATLFHGTRKLILANMSFGKTVKKYPKSGSRPASRRGGPLITGRERIMMQLNLPRVGLCCYEKQKYPIFRLA